MSSGGPLAAPRAASPAVAAVPPRDRREAETWLAARRLAWPPGLTIAARRGSEIAGIARLLDPNAGDGHHAAHVRRLEIAGDDAMLADLARAAVEHAGATTRVEAWCSDADAPRARALEAAGLALEVRLPEGVMDGRTPREWIGFGRAATPLPGTAPAVTTDGAARAPRSEPAGDERARALDLRWSEPSLRPALARFLATLVPGRAYPPGTLLSPAEELETSRPGMLEAAWLLALDAEGEVAGGLVLERPAEPGREHVRRVHLDVRAAWRGQGVATRLVARALRDAGARGVLRLEADPRSGHLGACRALEAGGLRAAGRQVRAWRLRRGGAAWDEDVAFYSGRCAG